ncbi:GMC oxidoreductase [Ramaria rubella]|nr:GMC oxidoreductase [Ramaria rubella]
MAFKIFFVIFGALNAFNICRAAIYESPSLLPALTYDFVIVGGGTAGNAVANRLTENPDYSVLVLEAGGSNIGVTESIVPYLFTELLGNNPFNWNYSTTPQVGLGGRSIPYPRGHLLGGCSSHNGMYYTRGSSDDYDRFARVTGDPGWSWDNLQPYIRKNEKWTEPTDHHNTTGQFNPAVHSFTGINSVSLAGFAYPIDNMVIQATQQLSEEFPFNLDMNSGSPLGVGWLQTTIKDGKRSSSATSYLGPEFIKRPNLHVLLNAQVTRLIKSNHPHQNLAFNTVEFAQSVDSPKIHVTASKEVVLSAGTIGTPYILMNSGIGDQQDLQAVGIVPILDLPSVGKNVSDQPFVGNSWFVNSTDTLDDISRNSTVFDEALALWNRTRSGPFVDTSGSHLGYLRLPENSSIFNEVSDPAAGPRTPHFEFVTGVSWGLINSAGMSKSPPVGHFMSVEVGVVSPLARGSVKLASNNPFTPPLIDPALFGTQYDMFVTRAAIRSAQRFLTAPAWKGYVLQPFGALANATTDDELDDYIRQNGGTTLHMVGSAAMSARDAKYGVVDPDLLVKGVTGLRIIDASVMPFIPSAHTQAATYIIAERGADLIKAAWS